jgi:uncharacterized protein (UPF0548 family)
LSSTRPANHHRDWPAGDSAGQPFNRVFERHRIGAPCRVVYLINEPGKRGFAYGTLPGHPERGEEAFLIEQHHDGTVSFIITAFSRPATPLARAVGPAGRVIQRHLTARYLRALAS